MQRDQLELLTDEVILIELTEVVHELEDLGEARQEYEDALRLLRVIVEHVALDDDVTNDYARGAHGTFPHRRLLSACAL